VWDLALIILIMASVLDKLGNMTSELLHSVDNFLTELENMLLVEIPRIARSMAVISAATGAFLWLSGLWRSLGRNLVMTGAMLYLVAYAIQNLA